MGRYVVLQEVGRGGMGRVLRAYDPKLRREVALKELRRDVAGRQATKRLVAEARAMAKLSHPNVVAVYDVEEVNDQVILVMEYVAGATLRTWLREKPRSWREVVSQYVEAGRGLAAAHEASLLHRDFKPGNVLVAPTGVKVTDFGLAKLGDTASPSAPALDDVRASMESADSAEAVEAQAGLGSEGLTEAGTVLGTPRYMAPEQHRGDALTPAADQYAFCVALWEALCGEPPFAKGDFKAKVGGPPAWPGGPTPRRVADAVCRGLAADPSERWPNMEALLGALEQDPAQARTRWMTSVAGLAALGIGAAAWFTWSAARAARCTEAAALEHLAGAWDDDLRSAVRESIVGIGASYADAVWERTERSLDAYAAAWTEMHVQACEATTVRGEQSTAVLDLRMACLHRARLDLQAAAQVLTQADTQTVQRAHEVTADMPPLARCADVPALQADVEPPLPHEAAAVDSIRTQLSVARAASRAGHYDTAREAVDAAKTELREVTYGPLRAQVAVVDGELLIYQGEFDAAEAALRDALVQGSVWRQWDTMQDAATRLVYLVGYLQQKFAEGLRYADVAEGLADGDPEREARLASTIGSVRNAMREHEEAAKLHERALTIRERTLGPDHPSVAKTLNSLAISRKGLRAYDEATRLHERALAIREKALGPDHPDVGESLMNLASTRYMTGEYAESAALDERALANWEKALGPNHPRIGVILTNLGATRRELREYEEAVQLYERALAIWEKTLGPNHPNVAVNLENLAKTHFAAKAYAKAETLYTRALAVRERASGPDHSSVGYSLVGLAEIALATQRPADAVPLAERALELQERGKVAATDQAITRLVLARALVDAGKDRPRALTLARQARDTYREAEDVYREEFEKADAFLRTLDRPG